MIIHLTKPEELPYTLSQTYWGEITNFEIFLDSIKNQK
jgi:hypothetical protein